MSEEAKELGAIPDTTTVKGHTLSWLTVPVVTGELVDRFKAEYIGINAMAAQGKSPEVAKLIMDRADEVIDSGKFIYGTSGYDAAIGALKIVPYLLYLCLREKHPRMTEKGASLLINDDNRTEIRLACLRLAGYRPIDVKKNPNPPGQSIPETPSISSPATEHSELKA